jgi:16S rRNA C967 or C1407 C5-methylase (RsmB/RsmF family)
VKRTRPEFNTYYEDLFSTRWPKLKEALEKPGVPIGFSTNLRRPYYLDPASIIAAETLGETGNSLVLDLCAAPGGKTLVLASSLGPEGRIIANERSSERRRRLIKVLADHLPPDLRNRVTVTGHDAARWGLYEQDRYDLVLLDAPCSSERHLVQDPKHLASWSPARIRHLAQQAYAMLLSAVTAAKPGGKILYSTCALSPEENERVVERARDRHPGSIEVLPIEPPAGEAAKYGFHIWPDRSGGIGPIYLSLLKKSEPPVAQQP